MSTEEPVQNEEKPRVEPQDEHMQDEPAPPTGPATGNKKRPRLDLATDSRERKRGKTVFGRLLGTLNKAKNEDKERNASEAAKKRQLIEQRLQDKLRKETDSVRRAEEAKRDKTTANRKEEDLQLKDSIYKLRRTRLPLLANYLSTSDRIPLDDASPQAPTNPLVQPPRSHPPPLYYLPAGLTPAQEAFLSRRKTEVKEAAEKEWESFRTERTGGVEEITQLRKRVAEEEEEKRSKSRDNEVKEGKADVHMEEDGAKPQITNGDSSATKEEKGAKTEPAPPQENGARMDVDDDGGPPAPVEETKKSTPPEAVVQASTADEDDAVEY